MRYPASGREPGTEVIYVAPTTPHLSGKPPAPSGSPAAPAAPGTERTAAAAPGPAGRPASPPAGSSPAPSRLGCHGGSSNKEFEKEHRLSSPI